MLNKIMGALINKILIFLGPVFIKYGQLLAYNYPILKELLILQDKCPGMSNRDLEEIKQKYKILQISDNCIAAGSISVVYLGLYKNKIVALKFKRKNIDKEIERSIYYSNILKYVLDKIPYLEIINIKCKMETIIDLYKTQTNFIIELENWRLFKSINENVTNVIIPEFYEEICNNELLVMEYLPGINISKNNYISEENKLKIGRALMGQYLSGLMKGVIHGDLHCGNISFTQDYNKIIIYDYGIIINLSDYEKVGIIKIINSIIDRKITETVQYFIEYFLENKLCHQQLEINGIEKIKKYFEEENLNILKLLIDIKKFLEDNKYKFNNKMNLLEISLLPVNNTNNYINNQKDSKYLIDNLIEDTISSILDE
jgi:predicted unusual protein kinase regulating ubiquinone biosynthesis (AarF/ABC1/UbiB family)